MNIAYIGLGTMGAPQAKLLLDAGHTLKLYNRTASKAEALVEEYTAQNNTTADTTTAGNATAFPTPRAAAEDAELIIINVSDTPDVQAVILGEDGIIHSAKAGSIVVDMSTISPEATKMMAQQLATKGIAMLDAPVSGGSEGAKQGTLSIMVGGKADVLAKVRPILEICGKTITHVGDHGAGQLCKAMNQVIIAGTYMAVAEGMALGLAAGIDIEAAYQAVSGGAASSWVLSNRARNMIDNDYPLGFRLSLHHKDLGIALDAAKSLGVSMPVTALTEQVETGLIKQGYGDDDMSAVARQIRQMSGFNDA